MDTAIPSLERDGGGPLWDKVKTYVHSLRPVELKDAVYEMVRKMILSLDLKAGEQLPVEALAKWTGTSRTPVREALLRLESDGLVYAISRVGFFVKGISKRDLRELFELREITEGYAAEKSVEYISDADISRMENLQAESVSEVSRGNLQNFLEFETELHDLIIRKSGNAQLLKMLESIKGLTYRERLLSINSLENVNKSVEEHGQIIVALKSRDRQGAGDSVRAHISAVKERLLQSLELRDETPE